MELAGQGAGVLLISSELEEVLGLAHRGYLMRGGRIADEIDCGGVTEADVLRRLFDVEEKTNPMATHPGPAQASKTG